LTDSESAEIRWYLSEYPENTFGEAAERAQKVEAGLKDLGLVLFQAILGSGDEARSLAEKASSTEPPLLSVVSNRPEFLGLPWELLNNGGDTYLASQVAGISRRVSAEPLEDFSGQMPTDQLNVLLLLPPSAEGTGSIASEVLAALESLSVSAELDCLRPSTEANLQGHLSELQSHYHLLHLDGFTIDGQGICMEDGSGGVQTVDAAGLAKTLNDAQTPVVLINASASSPLNDIMSFAAGLAQNGIPQVVVTPLPITGAGKVLFSEFLFKGLSGGSSVTQTVATVRQAMIEFRQRPSATGPLVSWDWTLPMVFESKSYSPEAIVAEEQEAPIPGAPQPEPEQSGSELPRGGLTA